MYRKIGVLSNKHVYVLLWSNSRNDDLSYLVKDHVNLFEVHQYSVTFILVGLANDSDTWLSNILIATILIVEVYIYLW